MIRALFHISCYLWIGFQSFGQVDTLKINVHIVQEDPNVNVDVFRCYLSNFEIGYKDGSNSSCVNSYHLIDLEDELSLKFNLLKTKEAEIDAISFLIGTDSNVNVSGAFDGDLDPIHGMYWTWNSGYINIKLEGKKSTDKDQHQFELHIGGYSGDQATARKVTLRDVKHLNEVSIYIDLGRFLDMIDLSEMGTVMSPGKKAVELANSFVECVHE